jgi:hypothetical protein
MLPPKCRYASPYRETSQPCGFKDFSSLNLKEICGIIETRRVRYADVCLEMRYNSHDRYFFAA